MLKKISLYLFKKPDEIGLDNHLVLIFSFLSSVLSILGTVIDVFLGIGMLTTISTLIAAAIFNFLYIYSWKTERYIVSKFVLILLSICLLNIQYFINYGSTGPILYLFVIVESFIIMLFKKTEKISLTILVFVNVTVLFLIEYLYPSTVGKYASESVRLWDVYTGLLIYLGLSVLLLNFALRFYSTQQEKAQEADRLKSAFLANMSHEIRTPMNGILGFAELLKEPELTGEEQKEYISIIEKSGARMLNLINDIIDISKIESGLMKVYVRESNVNELIKYVYSFFKPETDKKGIQFSFNNSLPSGEAVIKTDREKLSAILMNMVKNAIKFTDSGSIKLGYIKKNQNENAELEFFVTDTGIGIPKERHAAIFERFIQADISDIHAYQGAGLGLSISRAFVEMLGGKIGVESEPGKGSSFFFTIPYIT